MATIKELFKDVNFILRFVIALFGSAYWFIRLAKMVQTCRSFFDECFGTSAYLFVKKGPADISATENVNHIYALTIVRIMCILIVLLWGVFDFPPGMVNFSSYVLFAHCAPAFTVVMWGIIIAYIVGDDPPPKLMITYSISGAVIFIITSILQFANMGDYSGNDVLIMAILHLVTGVLFIVDTVFAFKNS